MFYFTLMLALVLLVPVAFAERGEGKEFRYGQREKVKAHREEQKGENKSFRETLKGKTKEEKMVAMKAHRDEQHGENMEFRQKIHDENMSKLKERLASNSKLTQAQKDELTAYYENQYKNAVSHRETQYGENKAFFDQISNDPNMTQEQRKAAIKAHFQTQKAENKGFRKSMHEANKAERQKIRGEVKAAAETVN